VERALRRGEVTLRLSTGVDEVGPAHVRLTGGRVIPADLILWCVEPDAPPLFRDSGLPVDGRGYLTVDDSLAVPGAAGLFGAGDAVAMQYAPRQTKSAGTAARQGPVLAHNLGIALGAAGRSGPGTGEPMGRPLRPSLRALALLNTGDGRAIFSYSGLVATAAWAMALKDHLDRRFIRRFRRLYI
jgi:NADH dehydrogenase FAD-containing subunit